MHFFGAAIPLVLLAGSALAQSLTSIGYPRPASNLTAGCNVTVQVRMEDYIENVDVIAVVVGIAPCYGGECFPPSSFMGDILYQGAYAPQGGNLYANYTVTVPQGFPAGTASLNVINFFMVGASYVPGINYVNETVTVVA